MFGPDKGNLHGGGKGQLFLVQHFLQLREKFGHSDIPLHLFVVDAVAITHDLRGAFTGLLRVLTDVYKRQTWASAST